MLLNYLTYLLLFVHRLIIAEHHRPVIYNHDTIVSISSVLGTQLVFGTEVFDEDFKTIDWYKGITDLKPLVNSVGLIVHFIIPTQSHYHIVNRTKLLIEHTLIGDEGFYTLKIQTELNTYKQYLYHVVLFTQNLSLFMSPPSYQQSTYHAEQQINFTCSVSFFTDRTYIEQSRSVFLSTWYMIIYNNDPNHYQLHSLSSTSYTYTAYLFNYELNQNDHNQVLSCTLVQQEAQPTIVLKTTLSSVLNIEYKAYLRGSYYFSRSFDAHSSIEINCEEFDANPKPVYTLIWILNGDNQTLLNKTNYGRYFIDNATWRHRGNYICLAENYLNNHHPAHQSFRLNIWFNEHQLNPQYQTEVLSLQQSSQSNRNKSIVLILLIIIFVVACLVFILSLYCFCLQTK